MAVLLAFLFLLELFVFSWATYLHQDPVRLGGLEKPSGFSEKPISAAAPERAASPPEALARGLPSTPLRLPPTAACCPRLGQACRAAAGAPSPVAGPAPHRPSPPAASFPVAAPPLHAEGTSVPSLPLAPPYPHMIWSRHPKRLCSFYLLFMAFRRHGRIQLWAIPVLLPNPDRSSVFLLK